MAEKSKAEFDGMTVPEIEEYIARAHAKIEEIRSEARASMRTKMEEMAAGAGLTVEEIFARSAAPKPGRKARKAAAKPSGKFSEPRYRDPKTGATWSGLGRPPEWLAKIDKADREKYRL